MTATLDAVTKPKPVSDPTAEQKLVEELVARDQGVSLTGPGGLVKQLTKTVLETVLIRRWPSTSVMTRTARSAMRRGTCGMGPPIQDGVDQQLGRGAHRGARDWAGIFGSVSPEATAWDVETHRCLRYADRTSAMIIPTWFPFRGPGVRKTVGTAGFEPATP